MALADQIIGVESGGNATATNPNSSAMGAGQFIAPTWLDMMGRYRPDLIEGKSRDEILAMRADPALSKEMTANYAAENAGILSQNGLPVTAGSTYLAHFAGPKGAVGVLSADPSTPVAGILGAAAVKANPFLAGMTAGDLAAWADRKMGGSAPLSIAPQVPAQVAPQAQAPSQPQASTSQQRPFSFAPAAGAPAPQVDLNALAQVPQLAPLAPLMAPQRINLAQVFSRRG